MREYFEVGGKEVLVDWPDGYYWLAKDSEEIGGECYLFKDKPELSGGEFFARQFDHYPTLEGVLPELTILKRGTGYQKGTQESSVKWDLLPDWVREVGMIGGTIIFVGKDRYGSHKNSEIKISHVGDFFSNYQTLAKRPQQPEKSIKERLQEVVDKNPEQHNHPIIPIILDELDTLVKNNLLDAQDAINHVETLKYYIVPCYWQEIEDIVFPHGRTHEG